MAVLKMQIIFVITDCWCAMLLLFFINVTSVTCFDFIHCNSSRFPSRDSTRILYELHLSYAWGIPKFKVTLRPTTSRSVSPGSKAHVGLTTKYLFLLKFTSIVLSSACAPSDERSGLSFVIVIVRPLLVNIYKFTCNVHVSYKYI
jgi:hypothetical protein